jgi:hypothetical protein
MLGAGWSSKNNHLPLAKLCSEIKVLWAIL